MASDPDSGQPLWLRNGSGGKGRGRGRGRGGIVQPTDDRSGFSTGNLEPSSQSLVGEPLDEDKRADLEIKDADAVHASIVKSYQQYEDDSEADEDEPHQHTNTRGGGGGGCTRTQEVIDQYLQPGGVVCLICIDDVTAKEPIWTCGGCYEPYHMNCIQKWVRDGIAISVLSDENFPHRSRSWFCPKCRREYNSKTDFPEEYLCFCRKVRDPPFDPWSTPHSCGEVCGQKLDGCEHACVLLCHPGACPPCPRTIKNATCHCGAKSKARRCGERQYSCGTTCSKLLSCGVHRCPERCHEGVCKPCPHTSQRACVCGDEMKTLSCSAPQWSCGKVCSKPLDCGYHICELVCHSTVCGVCPLAGERHCPCGKKEVTLACTEAPPLCGSTCDKLLECEIHTCTDRCHRGPCGTCRQSCVKTCRCKQVTKEVQCAKPLLCGRKCNKEKPCGRHVCKRKCCDGQCAPCEEVCNRRLACGTHKCQAPCHAGPCYPCSVTNKIYCACRSTVRSVPCGTAKTAKPPRCRELCKNGSAKGCKHSNAHTCHFGSCPPCNIVCSQQQQSCDHACDRRCHECSSYKEKEKSETCAPCGVMIDVACYGQHVERSQPCSSTVSFSCGDECAKRLSCEHHSCSLQCHTGVCGPCSNPCNRDRVVGCTHACQRPCHPDACAPCSVLVSRKCHCGHIKLKFSCSEWLSFSAVEKEIALSCKDRCPKKLECGHRCSNTCHASACSLTSDCKKKMTFKCKCGNRKRDVVCNRKQKGDDVVDCDSTCKQNEEIKKVIPEVKPGITQEELRGSKREGKLKRQKRWEEKQAAIEANLTKKTFVEEYGIIIAAIVVGLAVAWFVTA